MLKKPDWQSGYRDLFTQFGYPLTKRNALPATQIAQAEKRLGIRVPPSLRGYYLVAGRERRFGYSHNRILRPHEWFVDNGRLAFMEENQAVVRWGVSIKNPSTTDPAVFQNVTGEPGAWYREHPRCSVFLAVMLCYNAVSGGYRFCATTHLSNHGGHHFEQRGWTFRGEVNSLRAYTRRNQVLCLLPPGDLPFEQKWSVMIGGKARADLQAIADEVGLVMDRQS